MYRARLDEKTAKRFGSPVESNDPLKYLLRVGETGINIDPDIAGKIGVDPDDPWHRQTWASRALPCYMYQDMAALFKDIPLGTDQLYSHLPPPASVVMMGQYMMMAKAEGIPRESLIGTMIGLPVH